MTTVPATVPDDILSLDEFKAALPVALKKSINQELIDQINTTLSDPEARESYRDNLVSYTSVLTQGKFKMTNYLNAVRYISFKLLGDTNLAAYTKTFPTKYTDFVNQGIASKDIASYVTAYNKSKLVNLIYEQTLIPTHILNADVYQKAINKQAELMMTAKSEKVQSDAANSLLTHLKRPEAQQVELNIGVKEGSAITELQNTIQMLAAQQQKQITSGMATAKDIAHSTILIEGECKDVN